MFKRLRVRIANVISGGEIDKLRYAVKAKSDTIRDLRDSYQTIFNEQRVRTFRYSEALVDITEMATPKANGTVRKMARRAEEAIRG